MAGRRVKQGLIALLIMLVLAGAFAWQFLIPHPKPAIQLGGKSYSVADSTVADLLAFPEARALLDTHLPGLTSIRQIAVAKPLTLEDIAPFYPDLITEAALAALDPDLLALEDPGIEVYSAASTAIGVLLDDPDARAILDRHLDGFSSNPDIDQARGFTLSFIQKFDPEIISDAVIEAINADLESLAMQRAGG